MKHARILFELVALMIMSGCLEVCGQSVKISYQTDLSGVAHRIALLKGYYTDLGLEVEMSWYASGEEQIIDAIQEKAWDFGTAGVKSNIIGGPQGLVGVGIAMDQSATNQLVGTADVVDGWPLASLEGVSVMVTPNTTADYVVQACLHSNGYNMEDGDMIDAEQEEVIQAMTPLVMGGRATGATLGGLWSPKVYELLMNADQSQTLCTGASAYATVTAGHMARKEFAEESPLVVAKVLSGWLRAVTFMNNGVNKEEVLDIMNVFYEEHNLLLPRSYLDLEFRLVGLFKLPYQLDLMDRNGEFGLSNYDLWTHQVANYMVLNGIINEFQNATAFIDDQYMRMVKEYAGLRDWAMGDEVSGLTNLNTITNTEIPAATIKIGYQTDISGLAHRIAASKGYYTDLGLDIDMVWFESDGAQIAAANKENGWDFGSVGAVFNILGGLRGLVGVGIAMDESATTQLLGNAEGVSFWRPQSTDDVTLVVPANSNAEYVVRSCLQSYGYEISMANVQYDSPTGCVEELQRGVNGSQANYWAGLSAPYTYEVLDTIEGSETVCTGASVYATVTAGHMVRKEFAEVNPLAVSRVLSGWLRAVTFINNEANRGEVLDTMSAFFEEHNVSIPDTYLELDLRLVGLFGLQQQLDLMKRRGGHPSLSSYDVWSKEVGTFMVENGIIAEQPNPATFINDQYLRLVDRDPDLSAWAQGNEMSLATSPSLPQQVLFRADLSIFAEFWEQAKMSSNPTLRNNQPFTLFIPNNRAFLKMDEELLALIDSPDGRDVLTRIILHHTFAGLVMPSQTAQVKSSLLMLSGESLPLKASPLMMSDALILVEGTEESPGGMYHVIERVLIPSGVLESLRLRAANETQLGGGNNATNEQEASTVVGADSDATVPTPNASSAVQNSTTGKSDSQSAAGALVESSPSDMAAAGPTTASTMTSGLPSATAGSGGSLAVWALACIVVVVLAIT